MRLRRNSNASPQPFTHDVPEADLRTLAELVYMEIINFYQTEEGQRYLTEWRRTHPQEAA